MDEAGIPIVACERLPDEGCGLINLAENRNAVRGAMASLKNARITPDRGDALIAALREALPPDLVVEGEDARDVGFIHRRIDGRDVYFVSNVSVKARFAALSIPFCGAVRLYDPLDMRDVAPVSISEAVERTRLEIAFEPNQSLLLIVGERGLTPRPAVSYKRVMRLTGWTLTVDGETVAEGLEDPIGWERFDKTRHFSGEGEYSTEFTMPEEQELYLELTRLDCCCDVVLDGVVVASLWKAPLRARIGIVPAGDNRLTLRAVNTWINHIIDPNRVEPESAYPVDGRWPYFSNVIDDARRRRLYASREREAIHAPLPSGVSGEVFLVQRNV
jgi:hypothetical protein